MLRPATSFSLVYASVHNFPLKIYALQIILAVKEQNSIEEFTAIRKHASTLLFSFRLIDNT